MKNFIFIAAGLLLAIAASAQHKVVADKIVGIVGDKVILQSDINNAILDMQRQGEQLPPDAECLIMEQQLTIKALVMQSEKDSVMVDDAEIEALLDNQIRGFIGAYGSKEALEEIAGRTVYQIKEDFRQNFKERKLMEKMRNKIVENVKITPQEVKAYYDNIPKDSLAYIESEIEIGEIVLYPKASRELEKLAMDDLADFKSQVESGKAKFEALAALYTDDPGSKNNGGQYAINRTEKNWDPAFINHAFRLKEGQVSPVFKSKFGYHIIQMVSRAGDDAIVRHILLIPKVTDTEIQEAVNKLDTVRSQLIAGTISFGEAVAKYSEDDNSKFTGGMKQGARGSFLTIDQLDKDMAIQLEKMKVGEYSHPKSFTDERGKKAVRIAYLKSRTEPHRENLKDDYDRVAQRALEIKKHGVLEKWFTDKIPSYYLLIDGDYGQCGALQNWLQYAAKAGN
ncbi:MAG: peptidylprolyl isomerase [Chitinophagaceae bacterium]|nr:peptidylprolyl isomerase [Chitinophagaceae bacterium]